MEGLKLYLRCCPRYFPPCCPDRNSKKSLVRKEGTTLAYNFKVEATVVGRRDHEAAGYVAPSQGAMGQQGWCLALCLLFYSVQGPHPENDAAYIQVDNLNPFKGSPHRHAWRSVP